MRTLFRFIVIPIAAAWLFGGCSERVEPKPLTYSQLLTGPNQRSWRLISFQVIDDGNASQVVPLQGQFNPCITDDLYTFYANEERRFEASEGATKCNASDPNVFLTDQWTLINASATLEFAFPFLSDERLPYTIKTLTDNVLTIELYLQNVQDLNASYRFTFNASATK